MQLENKIAVITGGGSGIGFATAQLFAEQGAQVIIFEIDDSSATQAVDSIHGIHQAANRIVDVSNALEVDFCFQRHSLRLWLA